MNGVLSQSRSYSFLCPLLLKKHSMVVVRAVGRVMCYSITELYTNGTSIHYSNKCSCVVHSQNCGTKSSHVVEKSTEGSELHSIKLRCAGLSHDLTSSVQVHLLNTDLLMPEP